MFPDEIDRLFQILETLELIIESKILFRGKVGKFGSCQHQKTINNVKTNTTKHICFIRYSLKLHSFGHYFLKFDVITVQVSVK